MPFILFISFFYCLFVVVLLFLQRDMLMNKYCTCRANSTKECTTFAAGAYINTPKVSWQVPTHTEPKSQVSCC